MSVLDIKCDNAVSSTKNCCCMEKNKGYLRLGCEYQIYVSFNLPSYSYLESLKEARLILFKIPMQGRDNLVDKECNDYSVYPLLDFFSNYSCMYLPPQLDFSRKKSFVDKECVNHTEVDITDIVKAWIHEEIENKGLLLTGKDDTRGITYASDRYSINGMRPMLRLIYEDVSICHPLTMIPCTIEIENLT
ncbi:MAG: DNRLRE domain-containing protein [Velocimicrobium sp.]